MREPKCYFLLVCSLGLVSLFSGYQTAIAGPNQPSAPVEVVNVPLPVSLDETLDVKISNTPSVTLSGTPTVTVGNTASAPVYVVQVENHAPVAITFDETIGDGQGQTACGDATIRYTVPAGKQLIVEDVNFLGIGSNTPGETLGFSIQNGAFGLSRTFITQQRGDNQSGSFLYTLAQPTRMYFDENSKVVICAFRGLVKTGYVTARAVMTGYLVSK